MLIDAFFGDPEIHPESFISREAEIIGRVIVEKNVIIAPNVTMRADEGSPFCICEGANIQDGVIMHGLLDEFVEVRGERYSIWVGRDCSIAHDALVHGPCRLGAGTFLGFKSIVHKSDVGRGCFIGFGAVVNGVTIADGRFVPDGSVVNEQRLADALGPVPEAHRHFNDEVVEYNKKLVGLYLARQRSRAGKAQDAC